MMDDAPDILSDTLFQQFSQIIYDETGIHFTTAKRELLRARTARRRRALNLSVEGYLHRIQQDPSEMMQFLDAISTHHTFFFRESKIFSYLDDPCTAIWCAAASSGEEAYSIGAYCLDQGYQPSIWATDISSSCLDAGAKAVYAASCTKRIPWGMLKRYFQKGCGHWRGHIRVKPMLRRLVRFDRFNLLKDDPPDTLFDRIFCRNVMIYFDNATKERVVQKLVENLRSGGLFFIGGAESLNGVPHRLQYVEPSVYRKL